MAADSLIASGGAGPVYAWPVPCGDVLGTATAEARPNIALVKYWGKRDAGLNLPAAGSLSLTLDSLRTRTRIRFERDLEADCVRINGVADESVGRRVSACLDLLRQLADTSCRARVETDNNFPTAAGLASSASGFAALVVAADGALGLHLEPQALSVLARRGSGSAARSIFGGVVEMHAGQNADGEDAFAEPLLAADAWPLEVVVAVTSLKRKTISSGAGMTRSARTAPFYPAWVASVDTDLDVARAAVAARDFASLAEVSEHSCLKMHGVMMASRPPLVYWSDVTVACMNRVRQLREQEGLATFFTIDAGPQVKAVCLPQDADAVAAALAKVPGVAHVMRSGLGAGATCLDEGMAG